LCKLLLDGEPRRRAEINPLRVLDDKRPEMQEQLADAPLMLDYLNAECREHFETVTGMLDDMGVAYEINPRMVRGLDYYTKTCFEFVHDGLGAQSGIGGGGRHGRPGGPRGGGSPPPPYLWILLAPPGQQRQGTRSFTMTTATVEQTNKRSSRAKSQERLALALIAPTLIVLTIVIVIPVIQSVKQALYGQPGLDPETGFVNETEPFVGMKNFADIFTGSGERFWTAFWNTTLFGVVTVVLETILGVIMALIMHRAMAGRGIVRAAILVPWAIPTAVSAILWGWIFNQNGVANAIIGTHIMWASGNWTAKWSIIIADVWKTAPYIGLLTLAGLQVIPTEVYEAAKVDGANAWKRLVSITLPLVKPALVVAVLFRALDALRMFDLPFILVGPRMKSVETLSMLVQDEASNLRYGAAAAYAIILFLYVFIIAFAFIKILGADLVGDKHKRKKMKATTFVSGGRPGGRRARQKANAVQAAASKEVAS